ncbi:MAG: hypothetical protein KC414_14175 [Romboutsia sp.]|nr:hypothetical protein [Romboutsia sp.]
MDTRPIFVVITAKNCSACDSFKGGKIATKSSLWGQIQEKIKRKAEIRLIHIDVPQMSIPVGTTGSKGERIPDNLSRIVEHFPYLVVITGSSWNDSLRNPRSSLKYKVYMPKRGDTADGILSWVETTSRSHEFINSTPSMPTNNSSYPLEPRTKSLSGSIYKDSNNSNTNTNVHTNTHTDNHGYNNRYKTNLTSAFENPRTNIPRTTHEFIPTLNRYNNTITNSNGNNQSNVRMVPTRGSTSPSYFGPKFR